MALGFAFQDTAANFLAGILIAIRKPIRIGDIIKSNEEMGVIKELNLRATVIRNFQGEAVYIPNKKVLSNNIVNYSIFPGRRLDLKIGVSYGDNLDKVKEITLDAVKEIHNLDQTKETHVWFEEFGDSSINFTLAIWMKGINQPDYRTFKSDIVMAVKNAFDENNITIPFPIRTLDFGIKGGEKLEEMKLHIATDESGHNSATKFNET